MRKIYGISKGMKNCSRCKQNLSVDEFGTSEALKCGYDSRCKKCNAERNKLHYKEVKNSLSTAETLLKKEKQKLYKRIYYTQNKERLKRNANSYNTENYYKIYYGITKEEFIRKLSKQDNKCAICNIEIGEESQLKANLDHCHLTKKIRGVLCRYCNIGIGQFKEDIEIIKKAVNYLETWL